MYVYCISVKKLYENKGIFTELILKNNKTSGLISDTILI